MSKKRHDERPARRRSRYSRLAALGLLTLGSNLGCGREMLRIPSEADGTIRGPAPIPYSASAATAAASRKPAGVGPVELGEAADYGSSVNELFLASYRDSSTYGPHLAKFNSAVKSHGERPAEGSLIATNDAGRPQSPGQSQADAADPLSRLSAPPAYARQRYRDPLDAPDQPAQNPTSRVPSQNLSEQAQNSTPAPAPAPAPAAERQAGLSSDYARPVAETETKATSSSQPASAENQVSIPPSRRVDTPSEPISAVDVPMPTEPVKQTSATAKPAAEPPQADETPALPDLTVAPAAPVVEEVPTPKAEAPATEAPAAEAETPAAEVPTPAAEAPVAEVPTPSAEPTESLLPPAAAMAAPAEPSSEPAAPVELPTPQPPATDARAELETTAKTPELPSQEQAPATTPELPMPNLESATPSELPMPNQAPATTLDLPMPNQAPATTDVPMPNQAPATTDVPMPNQAPATPSLDEVELPELPMPDQAPAAPPQESATMPELPSQDQAPATTPELPMPNQESGTTPELPMPNLESATPELPMPNLTPTTPGPQDALELPELPESPTDLPLPKEAKQPQAGNSAEAAKREQPGETFKLASIPTPAGEPSKPEVGGAAQPEAESDSDSAPPLPPLQVDPSVFDAAIELPPTPPQPLAAPAPTATATAECPACMVLKKQKASNRWSNGQQANQTVMCPKCEESQARSKAKAAAAKAKTKAVALDAAL